MHEWNSLVIRECVQMCMHACVCIKDEAHLPEKYRSGFTEPITIQDTFRSIPGHTCGEILGSFGHCTNCANCCKCHQHHLTSNKLMRKRLTLASLPYSYPLLEAYSLHPLNNTEPMSTAFRKLNSSLSRVSWGDHKMGLSSHANKAVRWLT